MADDQSGGVPGRYKGENVAHVRDEVMYASQSSVPLALLTFDQEKAFRLGFYECHFGKDGFSALFSSLGRSLLPSSFKCS